MDYKQYLEQLTSRPIPKEMAFSEEEYRRRVEKVKGIMDGQGLDALLVTFVPNVCYMSGYQAFAADLYVCFVLPRDGEPALQVAELEIPAALLAGWVKDVRGVRWIDPEAVTTELVGILKERGLENKRIGVETKRSGLNIDVYQGLKRSLPNARLVDASDVVIQARMVKSSAELDHMRRAAAITKKGIEAALPAIKPGMTDNQVASVGFQAMVAEGSEYFSTQPVVTSGHRTGWVHTSFKRNPIKVGDTVILEFGAAYHRYTAAIMHTAVVGEPSDELRRVADASSATLDLLFQSVKPGRTAHDVALEVKKELGGLGDEIYWTGMFGYAIGLGFPPTWREMITYIAEGIDQLLLPGMTYHSPISLRIPGSAGIGFSETWAVTETGCEILTEHDRELYVIPA
ncbi:MAG: M24 family metallopeptidase [Dehalococcoidia bacterium]